MASSSRSKPAKNNNPIRRRPELSRIAPCGAIEYGLEEDVCVTEDLLAKIHEEVLDWSDLGLHDIAFKKALKYACTWGFVTGYKSVFNARIGVFHNEDTPELAIFLSFMVADTANTSKRKKNDRSAGTARFTEDNAGQGQTGVAETLQRDQDDIGMPDFVKRWVAKRILTLMLRCYGSIRFPKSVWFMEDWIGSNPPGLLLPYKSTTPDLFGRAEQLGVSIIEQTSIFAARAN
ncbi:hypothetical protein F4679DRAFT_580821 [Xylaria curta]|nr:hypothetical protein F4679DRAFT_580821 [Xylaria curta]